MFALFTLNKYLTQLFLITISDGQILGYLIKLFFKTGIDKIIKGRLDNKDWWRNIMSGECQNWIEQ